MTERKSSSKKRKRDLAEDLEFKLAPPILGSIGPTLGEHTGLNIIECWLRYPVSELSGI